MTQFMSNSLFFGAAISLIAYEAGLLLKRKFKMAIFNPLLIAIIAVIAVLCLLHIDYDTYNQSGQYISYLLTPATVCLAVPLYQQMELLKKNLKAVIIGIVSGVLASLVSVLILAKLFSLSHEQYVTLLPKSITTAIGMGVSEELGGIVTITVAVIIITGVLGDTMIYLAAAFLPLPYACAAGAIGGGLADLLTAPVWAPATIIIKMLICLPFSSKGTKLVTKRNVVALFLAFAISATGYYIAEGIMFGFTASFFTSVSGSIVQSGGSAIMFVIIGTALDKIGFKTNIAK